MPVTFAVVGPGRVGTALAALWVRAGWRLLGFAGGSPASAERAIAICGAGEVLDFDRLRAAALVLLTPPDRALAEVAAAAAAAVRPCSLWLHTSGALGLEPLEPLRRGGARLGALHPVCPVADAACGVAELPGKPAVLAGDPRSKRLLHVAALRAGLRPVWVESLDRALYHAACALAANGLTALLDLVLGLLEQSGLEARAARTLATALMQAALDASVRRGPALALSGPVVRGDGATVALHLATLAEKAPQALAAYRALMELAARLAADGGALDAPAAQALVALLRGGGRHGG